MSFFAGSACLVIIGSPVSDDSSICRSVDSISVPSAGISSPTSMITTSPTTMSLRATSTTLPSRRTFTGDSSPRAVSTLNFFAASISNQKPIVVARTMARIMPTLSINSPLMQARASEITAATSKILMIGSLYLSRYNFHKGVLFGGVSVFSPCSWRLFDTSLSVNPLGLLYSGLISLLI
ncbi:unknown [Prevotella sp. CAG:1124]|nr:unknown [Prevotella sp. CAG:1124]